ncbi:cell division protein ZapA [Azospira inquinata]|uniref:Cell division protein ZapA n=1 Tax=Azospira inquinata TaxID=2785627 RepID=A0A975SKN5_9RHOO|nr:cell division protein ZapA [Azospira inquinata]QWT46817.1 cell division protein ZapA [Azospira inquinata]QWT47861.1 cell division protein ZapA [Azospira inquinata]
MSGEALHLDVRLLGREYRVACPSEEREALLEAVDYLEQQMQDVAGKAKNLAPERVAVMVALNLASELLAERRKPAPSTALEANEDGASEQIHKSFDKPDFQRRIGDMEAQLDAVLQTQSPLF